MTTIRNSPPAQLPLSVTTNQAGELTPMAQPFAAVATAEALHAKVIGITQGSASALAPPTSGTVPLQNQELDGASSFANRILSLGDAGMSGDNLVAAFLKLMVLDDKQKLIQQDLSDSMTKDLAQAIIKQEIAVEHSSLSRDVKRQEEETLESEIHDVKLTTKRWEHGVTDANKKMPGNSREHPKTEQGLKSCLNDDVHVANPKAAAELNDQSSLNETSAYLDHTSSEGEIDVPAAQLNASRSPVGVQVGVLQQHLATLLATGPASIFPRNQTYEDTVAAIDQHRVEVGHLVLRAMDWVNSVSVAQRESRRC